MVIKSFMGHSLQDDITEGTYTSVTEEMKQGVATIMNDFLYSIWDKAKVQGALKDPNGRNGKAKNE